MGPGGLIWTQLIAALTSNSRASPLHWQGMVRGGGKGLGRDSRPRRTQHPQKSQDFWYCQHGLAR